jgi:hypothetical protein
MFLMILGAVLLGIGIYLLVGGGLFAAAAWGLVPSGAILLLVGIFMRGAGKNRARLMATGIDAVGTVVSAQQTNVEINNQPMVHLTLEITPPTSQPYTASVKTPVPIVVLSQVRLVPGAKLPVKIDPANQQKFIIDWNGAIMMQAQQQAAAPAGAPS